MQKTFIDNWLLSWWKLPVIFCAVVLAVCFPVLSPLFEEAEHNALMNTICGWTLLLGILIAIVHIICTSVYFFLHMQNLRALGQIAASFGIWFIGSLVFTKMAIATDPPSPYPVTEESSSSIKQKYHPATEALSGPAALCIHLHAGDTEATNIHQATHLSTLAQQHPDILTRFLRKSPRWKYAANDDTFYIQPGHVVFVVPAKSGLPGSIHAAFRTIAEGEQMPKGFTVITPGATIPDAATDDTKAPYIALELGNQHYLLLAWVGADNRASAFKGINAAIKHIDTELASLAKNPTTEEIANLCNGNTRVKGTRPELRLSEPESQYGIYQAEVYTNPGRPGTIILDILDAETKKPLHIFAQPAQYSENKSELFRHDFPAPTDRQYFRKGREISGEPYFIIKEGEAHKRFGITVEVRFSPQGSIGSKTELLIQKNYLVQAYEPAISGADHQLSDAALAPQEETAEAKSQD